jgi:hypothetical protein
VIQDVPVISGAMSFGRDSSSRMRIVQEGNAGLLEHGNRDLSTHGRELFEKDIQRVSLFEVATHLIPVV